MKKEEKTNEPKSPQENVKNAKNAKNVKNVKNVKNGKNGKNGKNNESAAERAALISKKLQTLYPEAPCALEYGGEPWKLMVMGRLSAQCTDKRVNEVCRSLFERFPSPRELACAELDEIEELIRPCGLFRVKAADIKGECLMLTERYGGRLPDTMEELLEFPGVGRKIANLLLGDIYRKGGIVADTHCIRICGRLGFYPEGDGTPLLCERTMQELIGREEQSEFCHRIVMFGREFCRAASPECEACPLCELCDADIKRKKAKK